MVATLLSLFGAFAFIIVDVFFPKTSQGFFLPEEVLQGVFGISLFLSLSPLVLIFLFSRKEAIGEVGHALACSCSRDKGLLSLSAGIFLLALIGLISCSQEIFSVLLTFAIALLCVGLIIDFLKCSFFMAQKKCTPDGIADWLLQKLKKAASKGDERRVLDSFELIFSLLAAYAKKGDTSSLRLFSIRVVGLIEELLRALSTMPLFMASRDDTLLDRYGVAEAMAAKRLTWVMKVTGESKSPTALEETMRLYGKLFMVFHNYHESLGYLLFVSLSQNLRKTEEQENFDKDAEYMMTCSELVKSLIDRSNGRKVSERNAIVRILKILDAYVKEFFRKNRDINPAFLMQPFAEIGQLLGSDIYAALPDRDDILSELRRILAQFSALEMVSTRLDMGEGGTDTKASYKEDLPFQGNVPK